MLDSGTAQIVLQERKFYVNFTFGAGVRSGRRRQKNMSPVQADRGRFHVCRQMETIFQAHHSSSTAITTLTTL